MEKNPTETDTPDLNQRTAQYIGRVFSLEEEIVNGRGRVKIGDSLWRVEGEDMPVNTKVKVVSTDGVILVVRKRRLILMFFLSLKSLNG